MPGLVVMVVGGGGREHAIGVGLSLSDSVSRIHFCPGNAGTSLLGKNHKVPTSDLQKIVQLAIEINPDLVVVGPEGPLVKGLADKLNSHSIPCFGPHSKGALLEGSKLHAKEVMKSIGVPTGEFVIIDEIDEISVNLDDFHPPWVVKRDVIAGGKGVTVTDSRKEAERAIIDGIEMDGFVLLEQHLSGEEASILVFMDETGYSILPASQDHKRVGEGDEGPNTGGMGAYAPAPVITPSVSTRIREEIIEPMHHHLRNEEFPYRGCLYVGLMIDNEGSPSVIEFNVRLGDPEAQVTIPLIATDLGSVLHSVSEGRLNEIELEFHNLNAATVVLASQGYPGQVKADRPVSGWDSRIEEGLVKGFSHLAGVYFSDDGDLLSNGGRVLSATGIAPSLPQAIEVAYQIIDGIELEGSHYRTDIGFRALSR